MSTTDTSDAGTPKQPLLRVISGNPTDEEIAALVVVFSSLRGAAQGPESSVQTTWGSPTDVHRPGRLVAPAAQSLRRAW